ncbi:MAG: hypothetical protein ACI8WT_000601 [Clostridium sp.]|jgi:hypothetical protein
MSLKKKRGSSLIVVLIIFAVLSISGISILSLTVYDYNARLTASKKTQSLYASDSGVNVVYGIMKKVISQAIEKGNEDADTYMTEFSQYSSTNLEPLEGDYDYLYSADGSLDTDLLKAKLNEIFQVSYKDYISIYITSHEDYLENGEYIDLTNNIISSYDPSEGSKLPTVIVTGKEKGFIGTPDQWKINITSQFSTSPMNGQASNKKTVKADIVISVPNYQDSYFVETTKQEISINPVWKNAISIDGDMQINSDLTVDGDVFVKGTPPEITDVNSENIKTKYNGGISIGSDDSNISRVTFKKNVVTTNSFNISGQNKTVNVEENIYAGNVYIGNSSSAVTNDASNCKLTVGQYDSTMKVFTNNDSTGMVYTSNDLSLYATKSHINIDKYYGINDIGALRRVDKNYNSSSSIIVNIQDIGDSGGSSIHIGEAIINGTAYINTEDPYPTGESVSIKGNYVAYTTHIPKTTGTLGDEANKYAEENVNFPYNDPLELVNNFKDPVTNLVGLKLGKIDKIEYFKKINELSPTILNKGGISGITINNLIFSAGVALSEGELATTGVETQGDVISKQNDFARLVYEMGDQTHLGVPMIGSTSDMLNDDYQQGKVYKDVFGTANVETEAGYQTNTTAQVNLNTIDYSKVIDNDNSEVEVINKNKNVVLLGSNSTYTPDSINDEVIDLTLMGSKVHGIIITQKNVILSGKIDFTGTIIAGGNLTAIYDGPNILTHDVQKILTYDDNYVLKTIGRDYINTYSKVFNGTTSTGTQIIEVAATVGKNADSPSIAIDGGLVKLVNWRVNN